MSLSENIPLLTEFDSFLIHRAINILAPRGAFQIARDSEAQACTSMRAIKGATDARSRPAPFAV